MALTKISEKGIKDNAITSAKIVDGTIANADISPSAAIADSKTAVVTTASHINVSALSAPGSTSVFLRGDRTYAVVDTAQQAINAHNISLLGFKMAVNEGLTVFNLVDGVVDEFNDESGTDEGEGTNDRYEAACDYYINAGVPTSAPYSAGFTTTSITEPDTSVTGTNPTEGSGTPATFTVPAGLTSITAKLWGAGAGGGFGSGGVQLGGGGGFSTGTVAVSPSQALYLIAGEKGNVTPERRGFGGDHPTDSSEAAGTRYGGGNWTHYSGGAGMAYLGTAIVDQESGPAIMVIGGGGGGGGGHSGGPGGAGGGLTGQAGDGQAAATGGSQTAGGNSSGPQAAQGEGGFLWGGDRVPTGGGAGGGAGYYGGGGGGHDGGGVHGSAGGGSSYFGHPQVTSGSTEGGSTGEGGGVADPNYVACTNEGAPTNRVAGEDGYILLTGSSCVAGSVATTVITSEPFASTGVPTTGRIVVFQENIDSPTLNTDVIASVSRNGGANFTTATLADSGYVTGASGQRILTGQATISGQPSGQSMRWKLNLANSQVKIHGVSLQWA